MYAVTGANGAIGREILRLLREDRVRGDGRAVVACVRSERAERQLPVLPEGSRVARVDYDDDASLDRAFDGVQSVIHLTGVLIEAPGSTYERANVETTHRVVDAARRASVAKLVLVSATGAHATSANGFYRSKARAEALVRASGLSHTILRAPLVLGPGTEGAAALRRSAAQSAPRLPGGGRHLQQPLHVTDLARACLHASEPGCARDRVLQLVGPEVLQDRALVERAAAELGRSVRVRSAPLPLLRVLLRLRGLVAGGFSADALEVVTTDTDLDPKPAADALGIALTPVAQQIRDSLEDT